MSSFFKYEAKNEHGETVKGTVEARNLAQASQVLRLRSLLIVHLDPKNDGVLTRLNSLLVGVNQNDIVALTRQLSTMITAGLSLTEALNILQQQSKPALGKLLDDLLRDVEGGSTFAKALEKHPKHFSRIYVHLVRAGEAAGVLDNVLQRLADNLEKDKEFKSKVKGAMIYPTIVIIALIIVAAVMMIFVIPKLTEMYQDFGADLPLATQILIDISTFSANFWWLIAVALAGAGFALYRWRQTDAGDHAIAKFLLKIPIYGKLRKKIVLTEFSRTLSLLLGAGISLLEALEIASDAVSIVLYRDAFAAASKRVEKGIALAGTLNDEVLFPPILTQMVAVGEETGKLDEVLMKISVYFQSESEQEVKNLTTAMEPLIMIVLGFGVALMVIAIIMPIYNLTSQF